MPTTTINDIRKKYPQYNDLSDAQLAQGLHKKYYADMDFGEFSKRIGMVEKQTNSDIDSAIQGGAQGVTFGFGDEIMGGLTAAGAYGISRVMDVPGMSEKGFGDIYRGERDKIRAQNKEASEENPAAYTAGYLGGAIANPVKLPGGMIAQAGQIGAATALGDSEADLTKGDYVGAAVDTAAGAALGGATAGLLKGGSKLAKPVKDKAVSKIRKEAIKSLQRAGIDDLSPAQLTGNRGLEVTESVMKEMLPTAGAARAKSEGQLRKFTAAALKKAGIEADELTPAVREQAETAFEQAYRTLTAGRTVKVDKPLVKALGEIEQKQLAKLPTNVKPIVQSYIDDLYNAGWNLSGEAYQQARSQLTQQARALAGTDPFTSNVLRNLRNALDEAAERSLPAAEKGAWRQLNRQYANYKLLQKAASSTSQDSIEGLLSPARLLQTIETANKTKSQKGYGDLYDLARSGKLLLADSVPNSGTAQRDLANRFLTAGASGAGVGAATYAGTQDPALSIAASAGGFLAAPKLAQMALNSRAAQGYFTKGLPGIGRVAEALPDAVKRGIVRGAAAGAGASVTQDGMTQQPQRQQEATYSPTSLNQLEPGAGAKDYLQRLAMVESSGNPNAKATTSSATGLFQFTDGTWKDMVSKYGEEYGLTLDGRLDPEQQMIAGQLFTQENADTLAKTLGREPTDGELYAAHFLGAGGAVKMLKAKPNTKAALLFPQAAKANRNIFYDGNRQRTVAEVLELLNSKIMEA